MVVEAEVQVVDVACVQAGAAAAITGEGLAEPLFGQVTEVVRQVNPNSVYANDPYTFSDLRTLRARIALTNAGPAAGLLNAQVNVEIESSCN
jgi:hypothetical protein